MLYGGIENKLSAFLEQSASRLIADVAGSSVPGSPFKIEIEIPKDPLHGDLASNVAMKLAKTLGKSPLELALSLVKKALAELPDELREAVERIEAKPPGFINIFLSKTYLARTLLEIQRSKARYGKSGLGRGVKVQVEFVSANPTGPLTIAHARQAALGDSIAHILEFLGYDVTREYYLNDEGAQMNILGNSIRVRYRGLCGIDETLPEDSYKGAYIIDIAKDFKKRYGKKHVHETMIDRFREFGMRWILRGIREDLKRFGVTFDVWYSQKSLRTSGKVEKALKALRDRGHIFEQEGAVWFKSTAFGDDKDRVVIKSDGSMTYLAPDIAYHLEKYRRNFKKIIDLWGPDHHGYVPRMKAAVKALGYPDDSLAVLIVQLATLYRSGQAVSMSTRAGEFVTLREVMDEVGKDVARFCFLMRRVSSHLDFDLDMVKKESAENPVFYIQYAHARIWSILAHSKSKKISTAFDSGLLKEAEEAALLRKLRQFPLVVSVSARTLEPYVIMQYLQDLATLFHSFYNTHRVVGVDANLTRARLVLVDSVRIVLGNGLSLLGVSLPKKM